MTVTFRFNAAACVLAQAIYAARGHAFDAPQVAWEGLTPAERALWVEQAQRVILANRPAFASGLMESFAGLTRQHAARVVGSIAPADATAVTS